MTRNLSPAKILPNEGSSRRLRAQEMKESAMMLCSLKEIGAEGGAEDNVVYFYSRPDTRGQLLLLSNVDWSQEVNMLMAS